jgi:LuxR family transcriptional regulator
MPQPSPVDRFSRQLAPLAPRGFHLSLHIRQGRPLICRQAFAPGWVAQYEGQSFVLRDPLIAWGLARTGAARWDEVDLPDPFDLAGQRRAWGQAHGMVAATGELGSRSILLAARGDRPYRSEETTRALSLLEMLHAETERPAELTPGQAEALCLVAGGRRIAAAAAALGISESAFKARLRAARQALGARTTAEAIQRAAGRRLI